MRCWCGHGPWHHWGPGCGYGPGYGYGPGFGPGVARGPRRRRARVEDLEDYLGDLEDEVAAVRAELEELKGRTAGQ
jgi:hypothetical protein